MKVGICVTKHKPNNSVFRALYQGTLACGDIPIIIESQDKFIKNSDVLIGIGETNDVGKYNHLRNKLISYSIKEGIRRLAIDTGFILISDVQKARRKPISSKRTQPRNLRKNAISYHHSVNNYDITKEYFSFGFDGTKNFGSYYNKNSPHDRFNKLGVEIKPWVESGDELLIIGINGDGFCAGFFDYKNWKIDTLSYLTQNFDNTKIVYRLHRKETQFDKIINTYHVKQSRGCYHSLEYDLNNKFVTITSTSNCSVSSIINGIPAICTHPVNVLYQYVSNSVEDFKSPKKPDNREQILADLAYAQWNLAEIESGEAWNHLRKYISDPPSHILDYLSLANRFDVTNTVS